MLLLPPGPQASWAAVWLALGALQWLAFGGWWEVGGGRWEVGRFGLPSIGVGEGWENIVIVQSRSFIADENQIYKTFNFAFENRYEIKNKAKSLMYINREKFTLNNMSKILNEIVNTHINDTPQQVSIKLPKLKKSKPKIKLEKETV